MLESFIIVLSFISIIPLPQRFIPEWSDESLRYFCPMLAASGLVFAFLWLILWLGVSHVQSLSVMLRGFLMTLGTLSLTGGLHLDGLMDTCDALFSHQDRETRLAILSDTHAGSFAVMGCVVTLLGKTLLFSELLTLKLNPLLVPVYSRLGMAVLLNNLPFAKSGGLAVSLGSSRSRKHNIFFAAMMAVMCVSGSVSQSLAFGVSLLLWMRVCVRVFGGITGDLLGAFVELSEVIMMAAMAVSECI